MRGEDCSVAGQCIETLLGVSAWAAAGLWVEARAAATHLDTQDGPT